MAPLRNRGTRAQNNEDQIFEGLPIRNWRIRTAVTTSTNTGDVPKMNSRLVSTKFQELPMSAESQLLQEEARQRLRFMRMHHIAPPIHSAFDTPDDEHDDEPELQDDVDDDDKPKPFTLKRWSQMGKGFDPPEREYLAKRRKGLPPFNGLPTIYDANGILKPVQTVKVRKYDAQGVPHIYEVVVPIGHKVDGEILDDAKVAETAAPGTVIEGLGVVNQEGIVVAQPIRRRPPIPRKKRKGGPGRHKKIKPIEEAETTADPAASAGQDGADTEMKDVEDEEEEDEGSGEEGEIIEDDEEEEEMKEEIKEEAQQSGEEELQEESKPGVSEEAQEKMDEEKTTASEEMSSHPPPEPSLEPVNSAEPSVTNLEPEAAQDSSISIPGIAPLLASVETAPPPIAEPDLLNTEHDVPDRPLTPPPAKTEPFSPPEQPQVSTTQPTEEDDDEYEPPPVTMLAPDALGAQITNVVVDDVPPAEPPLIESTTAPPLVQPTPLETEPVQSEPEKLEEQVTAEQDEDEYEPTVHHEPLPEFILATEEEYEPAPPELPPPVHPEPAPEQVPPTDEVKEE